jgi:hypothetical protein
VSTEIVGGHSGQVKKKCAEILRLRLFFLLIVGKLLRMEVIAQW